MNKQRLALVCMTILAAASCTEIESKTAPHHDVRQLTRKLASDDERVRDYAAETLVRIAWPMRQYVKEHQTNVLKVPLSEVLDRFDVAGGNAVQALVGANPQASKHVYIFQAYCWPRHPMRYSRGDSLRFIPPPKGHTGKWAYWYENGALAIDEVYEDGKLHGITTHWRRAGNSAWKWKETVFQHGKSVSSVEWNERGQERFRNYWKEGAYYDVRTGWNKDGTKAGVWIYKNSKPHGTWLRWYENGQKWKEENYHEGNRHGTTTVWYRNGHKVYTGEYRNGKKHGLWTTWFENGQKQREENYQDGKLRVN